MSSFVALAFIYFFGIIIIAGTLWNLRIFLQIKTKGHFLLFLGGLNGAVLWFLWYYFSISSPITSILGNTFLSCMMLGFLFLTTLEKGIIEKIRSQKMTVFQWLTGKLPPIKKEDYKYGFKRRDAIRQGIFFIIFPPLLFFLIYPMVFPDFLQDVGISIGIIFMVYGILSIILALIYGEK